MTHQSLWAVTIVWNTPPDRLAMILRTWDISGFDGILVVRDAAQELPFRPAVVPRLREVIPRTDVLPHRATWRNIACRFAPADDVAFLDADCVCRGQAAHRTRQALQQADLVVFPPAWSNPHQAERFLAGESVVKAFEGVSARPEAAWAGTLALSREMAIEVSWDDRQTHGWGDEDRAFCRRVGERVGGRVTLLPDALVHVWHPLRRGPWWKHALRQNRAAADGRAADGPEGWLARAEREIAMLPLGAGVAATLAHADEAATRQAVVARERWRGWPALACLATGREPDGCLYDPVIGATVLDWPATS